MTSEALTRRNSNEEQSAGFGDRLLFVRFMNRAYVHVRSVALNGDLTASLNEVSCLRYSAISCRFM